VFVFAKATMSSELGCIAWTLSAASTVTCPTRVKVQVSKCQWHTGQAKKVINLLGEFFTKFTAFTGEDSATYLAHFIKITALKFTFSNEHAVAS